MNDQEAIREGVAVCLHDRSGVVRVDGPGAWEALDRLLPCNMALRDGQGRHTLLVAESGAAEADVVVVAGEDTFWLFVDGVPLEEVVSRVARFGGHAAIPELARIEIAGPFAWELVAKVVGPGVVGLPYLEMRADPILCLRSGRTGEYGYDLVVPHGDASALREHVLELGRALDVREVPRNALDDAALESGFYVPRRAGLAGLDPLELQLQWRLSWQKEWPGSTVLRERRERGPARRIVGFRASKAIAGAAIRLDDDVVGEVRIVLPEMEGVIGYALVDSALAHPGLPGLQSEHVALALVSRPFVANLSLFVKPQRHRYANRADVKRP